MCIFYEIDLFAFAADIYKPLDDAVCLFGSVYLYSILNIYIS